MTFLTIPNNEMRTNNIHVQKISKTKNESNLNMHSFEMNHTKDSDRSSSRSIPNQDLEECVEGTRVLKPPETLMGDKPKGGNLANDSSYAHQTQSTNRNNIGNGTLPSNEQLIKNKEEGSKNRQPRFSPENSPPIILDDWAFSSNHKTKTNPVPKTIAVNRKKESFIRGIPNYGQTCFLSSVLQSLASLNAFNIYLKTHVRGHERSFPSPFSPQSENGDSSSLHLTRLLWQGLQHINGRTDSPSTTSWDPRGLLEIVGQSHRQFESIHQQQDAQELLTALLDVLVQEQEFRRSFKPLRKTRRWLRPRLPATPEPKPIHFSYTSPSATWAMTPSFLRLQMTAFAAEARAINEGVKDDEIIEFHCDDDMVSVAFSARERAHLRRHQRVLGISGSNSECNSSTDQNQSKSADMSLPGNQDASVLEKNSVKNSSSNQTQEPKSNNAGEEKKQEEFELHVPRRIGSIDDLTTNSFIGPAGYNEDESETNSAMSASGFSQSVSQTSSYFAVSSRDPLRQPRLRSLAGRLAMPISGWMGSTLQCRTCHYVRPIQNVPFVDISIIPTGVSRPYSMGRDGIHRPCTVEECLSDFTKIERVEHVECPSCTKRDYELKAKEEVEFWQFALDDATKIQQKKMSGGSSPSGVSDLQSIQEELNRHIQTLQQWQQINCDDADCAMQMSKILGNDDTSEKPSDILFRRDANKCLFLTRLPPVLCLHVQRRYYDAQTARLSKTTQPVLFDEYLNIAPYCAYTTSSFPNKNTSGWQTTGAAAPTWVAGTNNSFRNSPLADTTGAKQIIYQLMAVLEHFGGSNSGHYVCYRRSPTGEWWYISDHLVRQVSWQRVRQCQAYMLFYENSNMSEH